MKGRVVFASVLSALAIVAFALEVSAWPSTARLGVGGTFAGASDLRVTTVAAANAVPGVRVGDLIDLRATDYLSRLVLVTQNASPMLAGQLGETIHLAVRRGNSDVQTSGTLTARDPISTFASGLMFKLFFLVIGIFVLWRGRDLASLFLGIWTLGLLVVLPGAWWGAFSEPARLVASVVSSFLWVYSPVPLYFIIESLSHGVLPRPVIIVARWLMLSMMIPEIFEVVINATARVATGSAIAPIGAFNNVMFIGSQIVMATFFLLSYVAVRGEERQRVHWVFWSFIVSRFGVLANLLGRLFGLPLHLHDLEWLTVMVFPAGCAYGILRHKLMDVNVIVNRAIVYTVLTTVVVAVFLTVEALFQHFEVARGLSLTFEIALAVGIGLSMNTVHQRVESAIGRLLFSRKHEAERKLATLAEEAAFIENPQTLLRRTVDEIAGVLQAKNVTIYERADGKYRLLSSTDGVAPAEIDSDDPAFVRLRKSLEDIDLSAVSSALGSGGYAFPLSVRGRMFGALVCGPRSEDEPYSGEERTLLHQVAREVGAELHLIRSRDLSELARDIASGKITPEQARQRAQELTETRE